MNNGKILIVDDDENIRLSYKYFLESEGFEVYISEDSESALNLLKMIDVDVALLDLRMSGETDGLLLNKKIKLLNQKIQTIIITAYTDYGTAVQSLKEGAFDYISKTVENAQLLDKIKKAILKKKSINEIEDRNNFISLTLICGHTMTMKGYNSFCEKNKGFKIENQFKTYAEYSLFKNKIDSDIILLCSDCNLNKLGKESVVEKISLKSKNSKILIINHKLTLDEMSNLVYVGVSGFIPTDIEESQLILALEKIKNGETWAPREVMSKTLEIFRKNKIKHKNENNFKSILSRREKEILTFVALDYHNKEIADQLSISVSTVKTHLYNIFEKLNVKNRNEAAFKALSEKLID